MVGVRRGNARSDDSGDGSNPKQHPTIEEWVARKEKFRVVADGLPMIQSLMTRRCDPVVDEFFEKHVRHLVPDVLNRYHISFTVMHLDYWYPRHQESDGKNTLVVYTRDTNNTSWSAAAKTILSLFYIGEADEIARSMQVEIRNRDEMYNDYSRPLPDDTDLVDELSQISGKVSAVIHTLMRGSWSSIAS